MGRLTKRHLWTARPAWSDRFRFLFCLRVFFRIDCLQVCWWIETLVAYVHERWHSLTHYMYRPRTSDQNIFLCKPSNTLTRKEGGWVEDGDLHGKVDQNWSELSRQGRVQGLKKDGVPVPAWRSHVLLGTGFGACSPRHFESWWVWCILVQLGKFKTPFNDIVYSSFQCNFWGLCGLL